MLKLGKTLFRFCMAQAGWRQPTPKFTFIGLHITHITNMSGVLWMSYTVGLQHRTIATESLKLKMGKGGVGHLFPFSVLGT